MAHCFYPFNQQRTPKKICINHHGETHSEDPIRADFFNYAPKKGLYLYSESLIRKGLHLFHNGSGGAYGRFDL
jgi:hypothetical protein